MKPSSDEKDDKRWEWPVNTVGKLIANLQTLPPDMPFYTAYFVEIDGARVTRTRSPSLSYETTDGFRVAAYDKSKKSLVMWASQEPAVSSATTRSDDTKRLDWMEKNPRTVAIGKGYGGAKDCWFWQDATLALSDAATLRDAIDAAIRAADSGTKA